MSVVFEPLRIGSIAARNRLVRAATYDGQATPEGCPTPAQLAQCDDLARGGAGAVITGYAYVRPDGIANPGMFGIYDDAFAAQYADMAARLHAGGAAAIMQIVYGGSSCKASPVPERILGPSAIAHPKTGVVPVEATADELHELAGAFAAAAVRAKAAGFDGVELHAAHGYLLSQFLSPLFNHRADEYGGSIEGRSQFPVEVLRAVRRAVGEDYPVLVKINSSDGVEGGLTCEESLVAARRLASEGAAAIEVSGIWGAMKVRGRNGEPLFAQYALELAQSVEVPVILTGGCRELGPLEALAKQGIAGFGVSRPLICEPDLPQRWERQLELGETPASARCISCSKCLTTSGCRCIMA